MTLKLDGTKLWLDAEWNDFKGTLISMALIDEDGNQWYEERPIYNPSPWVLANVVPHLLNRPVLREVMQNSLSAFLAKYDKVHIIADWPEDIERFCELLIIGPGLRIDTPPIVMEIRRDINSDASKIPHNALSDAIAIKEAYLK